MFRIFLIVFLCFVGNALVDIPALAWGSSGCNGCFVEDKITNNNSFGNPGDGGVCNRECRPDIGIVKYLGGIGGYPDDDGCCGSSGGVYEIACCGIDSTKEIYWDGTGDYGRCGSACFYGEETQHSNEILSASFLFANLKNALMYCSTITKKYWAYVSFFLLLSLVTSSIIWRVEFRLFLHNLCLHYITCRNEELIKMWDAEKEKHHKKVLKYKIRAIYVPIKCVFRHTFIETILPQHRPPMN